MKILDRLALRSPLKHLALACAVALGLGAGTARAAVTDISGANIAIDTVVGAGNTGRLIGTTTTTTTAITKDLDLNGNTLTLNGNSNGAISGSGTVIVNKAVAGGTGNTYTGTTTVSASVALAKTAGNALCGDISVAAGATVNWGVAGTVSANDQIADDANVTLTSTSRLMLYASEWAPNQAATTYPVNSDTIGKLYVTTGAKVYTGIKAGGWGGVLSVSELWIDGVKQPNVSVVENATGTGLVRGNGYIQVGGSAAPTGPPTRFKLDGAGSSGDTFYLNKQVVSPGIPGVMIGNCIDSQYATGFTGSVDLNGYQLTIGRKAGVSNTGAISGNGVLVIAGGSIGGSTGNTYTGTTTVTGTIALNKTVGNALCSDFTVPAGATVNWGLTGTVSANDQIADDANVTLTSTSRLILYASEFFPNQAASNFPINSDTIGKLYVTTGAKVYTGVKASGWGGVLSVSELWIDGVKQPDVSVVENADASGLVRGNGWIQVNGSAAPSGPAPTTFKLDGAGSLTEQFYLSRQVMSPITGVMIGNCVDSKFGTGGFTGPVNLNGHQLTLKNNNSNGAISGNGVLVIASGSIGGSTGNTYTGTTTVTGAVTLSKTAGSALCGDISVGASSGLTWSYANQISDLSNVTLSATSSLALAGKADTIAGLTLATGALVNTGTGGVLTLNSLTVDGVVQPAGTYTSSNSAFVTGSGSVQVALSAASPYVIWASTHAGGQSASEDYDHDGVSNGLKYYMGAAGTLAGISPPVVTTAGVRTVTWPRDPTATVASVKVQVSSDLAIWNDVPLTDPSINATDPTKIVYTLPGGAEQFCRLVVTP